MLCDGLSVQLKRHQGSTQRYLLAEERKEVSRFKMVRNGFHDKEVAAQLHRRACAGVCASFLVGLACTKQVSGALMHVRVRTLYAIKG